MKALPIHKELWQDILRGPGRFDIKMDQIGGKFVSTDNVEDLNTIETRHKIAIIYLHVDFKICVNCTLYRRWPLDILSMDV